MRITGAGGTGGASTPSLYLPGGWDTGWKAAVASRASSLAWATLIGDSLVYGTKATNQMTTNWAARLSADLATRYGMAAHFWTILYSEAGSLSTSGASFAGTPPFVVGGAAPGWNGGFGFGQMLRWPSGAPANALTFTTPYACTNLDIVYYDRATSSSTPAFTYTVDGGAPINGPVTTGSAYINRVQITGLANTTHTIVFSGNTGNDAMVIQGMTTYSSRTSGVGLGFLGWPAAKISDVAGVGQLQSFAGWRSSVDWAGLVGPSTPHLAILAFGVNELNGAAVGPDSYFRMNRAMIQYLRRARPAVSILFVINSFPSAVTSDSTSVWTNAESFELYTEKIYSLAATYTCGVANIHARWGQTSVAQGFRLASDPHYIDAGYADVAAFLGGIL